LRRGVDLAIAGDWDGAHQIAQSDEADSLFCWLHAILHKIEGDNGNSRYWYRRAGRSFDEYSSPEPELLALRAVVGAP